MTCAIVHGVERVTSGSGQVSRFLNYSDSNWLGVTVTLFFQRCFYYAAGLYHRELSKNEKYRLLKPVYVISFLAEELTFEKKTARNPTKSSPGI